MSDYNYSVGGEIVLFEDSIRMESFGKVVEIRDNTVLCTMGTDEPIEYNKGVVIPINDIEDLFERPELIPDEVQAVLSTFDEDNDSYAELDRLLDELEPLGYIFSYYLDAEPYWLRKIVVNNLELSK
jgi:hypothetical protein